MMYELFKIMDCNAAALLCFLMHHHEICSGNLPKNHGKAGWFWCTVDTVTRRIGWNAAKQQRVLRKLKRLGYIEAGQHRKRNPKGVPTGQPVRWLRIDMAKIVFDIEAAEAEMWSQKVDL